MKRAFAVLRLKRDSLLSSALFIDVMLVIGFPIVCNIHYSTSVPSAEFGLKKLTVEKYLGYFSMNF